MLLSRLSAEELTKPCSVVVHDLAADSDDTYKSDNSNQNVHDPIMEELAEDDCADDVIESSQLETTPPTSVFTSVRDRTAINSFYEYPTMMEAAEDDDYVLQQEHSPELRRAATRDESPPPILLSSKAAPSRADVSRSCEDLEVPGERYQDVFCSKKADVPPQGIDLGKHMLVLPWERDLPEFGMTEHRKQRVEGAAKEPSPGDGKRTVLQSVKRAPTRKQVCGWVRSKEQAVVTTTLKRDDSVSGSQMFNPDRTILRVRQDSGDSLGSELSLSSIESDCQDAANQSK